MKLHGISKSGLMLTTLVASIALVPAGNAEYAEGYYPENQQDAATQLKLISLDNYYSRDGIYLSRDQILEILADEPEAVEFALADVDFRALQSTNGTAHFEVNGEGQIRSEKCTFLTSCINKWAGAYVHTPDEHEVLLGYRYTEFSVKGSGSGNKAVWGINSDGVTRGELGSSSTSNISIGGTTTPFVSKYGVRGEASSIAPFSRSYGVYGKSTVNNGYGIYGVNTAGGSAGYFDGPVRQDNDFGGVVKAAAFFWCGDGGPPKWLYRSFGPQGTSTTVGNTLTAGKCTVEVGFDISERYIQTTALSSNAVTASCYHVADDEHKDRISCRRFDLEGFGANEKSGEIMLTIY